MSVSYDFSGRKYLVTGGSRGIGRGIVEALLKAGAEVVAVGRSEANLAKLKEDLPALETLCVDVANVEATKAALEPHQPFDGLVNNAAVLHKDEFLDLTAEHLDDILNVNLRGAVFVAQAVAKAMVSSGKKGSVVNVSSIASRSTFPSISAYAMSKAALDSLTRHMAIELAPKGIRVNSLNPTLVKTDMAAGAFPDEAFDRTVAQAIPMARAASVEDCAEATLWLLSDASGMTSGTSLPVDGAGWAK